jgi:hypothetical protein
VHGRLSSLKGRIRQLLSAVHRERERKLKNYSKMQGLRLRISQLQKELAVGYGNFADG